MTRRHTTFAMPRPTRRGVLQGGAALAGVAGLGLLPTPARAAPKRGGSIRVAIGHGSTSDILDPGSWENDFTITMAYAYCGYLTGVARDGSLEPQVAESWEASTDAAEWRFKLRSGVTFHSGKSVTADDVVNSIRYHMGEDSTSAAKPLLAGIEDIVADGDTVVFKLNGGNADFPFTFTDYHLPILPPGDDKGIDFRSIDGCGPYKMVDFNPGVSAKFVKNENDWDSNRGFFDEAEVIAVIDANARTTSLVSGDVNMIDRLDLKTVGLMARNPNVTVHSVAGNQHYTFPFNLGLEPFTDVNVRKALKYAINRQEMVDKILFGYGSLGNDHPIGQGQRFFNGELEQLEYDPDKSKFYLKEAGLTSLDVELSVADAAFAGAVDAGVLYQSSAKGAGINLNVNRVPNDGYWSDVWMKHPWSASYWGGRPTEDAMFATAYSSGAAWNESFWESERFNELLVMARSELDEAKRREQYYEMQQILSEEGSSIIPMFANYVFATGPGIETNGDNFSSHWDKDGHRWMERWSFA
ncbi:MAG: ABC transporter substrate-binding protein [Pseudomonadota bacterium]